MASLPILGELPPGFFVEESPRGILALASEVARDFHAAGFGPETDGDLVESELFGRSPLLELHVGDVRYVVRRYRHGGLLRWLTGPRYWNPERAFRELILAHELQRGGVPTAQVVGARARFARWGGYWLDLVTRRIEDSLDLGRVLALMGSGQVPRSAARQVLRATGALVRAMHRMGFVHADLTPRNLLVQRAALEGQPPNLWVIDLEGSRIFPDVDRGTRARNLRRLYRHVDRLSSEGITRLSRADLMAFLSGYEPDRAARRELWRAIGRRHRRSRRLHAAGWFFERRLSKHKRDVRERSAQTEAPSVVPGGSSTRG